MPGLLRVVKVVHAGGGGGGQDEKVGMKILDKEVGMMLRREEERERERLELELRMWGLEVEKEMVEED